MEWTRDTAGRMVVSLNSEEIIATIDQSVKTGFDGLAFVDFGGDYIAHEVEVRGAR